MTSATEIKLQILKEAIRDKTPYCSGVCSVPPEQCVLFYKTGRDAGQSASCIDLSNASPSQLEQLSDACTPATFGVNDKNVLDESYRKAGKLSTNDFASKFDLEHSGLIDLIRSELLEGHDETEMVETELYSLNVYGKDSFFKSHIDTPRGKKMFGSLVIVFPTMHEGGELVLRHEKKEWIFDSAAELSDTECSIGYIAFYSDIEHEVQVVKAGYRVTLTYNLYFTTVESSLPITPIPSPTTAPFLEALSSLLADPEFLPEGGNLGFGLRHQYPIGNKLGPLLDSLKGSDAVVAKVCADLGLDLEVKVNYQERCCPGVLVMTSKLVNSHTLTDWGREEEYIISALRSEFEGQRVLSGDEQVTIWDDGDCGQEWPISSYIRVWWVTTAKFAQTGEYFIKYGNEPSIEYLYGHVCLVVRVGKPGQRSVPEPYSTGID